MNDVTLAHVADIKAKWADRTDLPEDARKDIEWLASAATYVEVERRKLMRIAEKSIEIAQRHV